MLMVMLRDITKSGAWTHTTVATDYILSTHNTYEEELMPID